MSAPDERPGVSSLTAANACRVITSERLWVAAALASAAVRRDGRQQFTAVALLVWCDLVGLAAPGVLGVPIATLLARFDTYADEGVWDAIAADSDVTGDDVHHAIATHAQQMTRQRRAAGRQPPQANQGNDA
jgi:hypothetical protein